jgi:hypothetical protein
LDYYINMVSVFSDKIIIVELLKYFNRALYVKIKSLDSDLGSILFPLTLCLFTKSDFNREVTIGNVGQITKILWDYLLVDGFVVVFKACLVIFDILNDDIMSTNDFAEIVMKV